jgi:3-deoxy-manno-octulosonate cytidylyltransferase (CMP-KDO synthetase)
VSKRVVAVIPSRYGSTRLPAKPLLDLLGKPLVQRVYERAALAAGISKVVVATDDRRIFDAVRKFGGDVEMTSPSARSGTERIVEIANRIEGDIFINVQGDEPLLPPEMIEEVIALFDREDVELATLSRDLAADEDVSNPNLVKVVADRFDRALYFSRSPIPYFRNQTGYAPRIHVGIYGYTRKFLERFSSLEYSLLEETESLEQLRWLENGHRIIVGHTARKSVGVDTMEDYEKVLTILRGGLNSK